MIRVAHVITGLEIGGMENLLAKILSRQDRARFSARVMSLTTLGGPAREIEAMGVSVQALGMSGLLSLPLAWHRLTKWLREEPTDLVQTWMYHADFLGGLAAKRTRKPVIWTEGQSNLSPAVNRRSTLLTARACAFLSRTVPARVAAVGQSVARAHAAFGYAAGKIVPIPNGFDADRFAPDPAARAAVRAEFHWPADAFLVGIGGRLDPQKDQPGFLAAFAQVAAEVPGARALLWGDNVDDAHLGAKLAAHGLQGKALLLGRRPDLPRLLAALDVYVNSSVGEGFASVIGEAMAAGVPCAVTNVGDSADIVSDTGRVAAAGDPVSLAQAILALHRAGPTERHAMGQKARARVLENFTLNRVARRYEALYEEVSRA